MKHKVLWNIFYGGFGLIFLNLFLRTLFLNYCYDYPLIPVLGCVIFLAGVLLAANFILEKFPVLLQYSNRIFFGGLAVQFMVLLWMGTHLETVGNNDFGSVYHSAETWVLEQRFPEIGYFAIYPNNMGAFLLLKDVFQVMHWMGWRHFFLGGLALNLISIFCAITGVYFLAKKLLGDKAALLSFVAFGLWCPLYFWVAVFYTDMLSLGYIPWVLYFCVKALEAFKKTGVFWGLGWWCAACLTAAIGSCIKSVVWIPLIAGFVWLALQLDKKQLAAMVLCAVVLCSGVNGIFQWRVNGCLPAESREKAFPAEHWIMMGLVGDGSYNHADFLLSSSIDSPEERREVARNEIALRLKQRSPVAFWKFLQIKQLRSFGSGNADVHHFLEAGPVHQSIALQLGASYGEYHYIYEYLSQGWLVLMLGSLSCIAAKGIVQEKLKIPLGLCCGAILGLWMFLLIWEAGQRYLIAGIPMMAFVMAAAFDRKAKITKK